VAQRSFATNGIGAVCYLNVMTVDYCLRRAKQQFGNCVAIELPDRQITYRQFYQLTENSASKLATLGASKGDRIAVLMNNSL
jgi:acyl-CoA synthetase (AMP-forming)/AMP-acid ligase II